MRVQRGSVVVAVVGALAAACASAENRPPPVDDNPVVVPADAAGVAPRDAGVNRKDAAATAADASTPTALERTTAGAAGTARPSPRRGHAMAYDQARGKVVLFGGYSALLYCPTAQRCGDTWEWDGNADAWTKMTPASGEQPSPREQHAMTYDPLRQRVVLFGGTDGTFRQDMWEWDGTGWTDVTPTSAKPSPRQNAGLVWDTARGRAVLFGGGETDGANPKADTWEWDGATGSWRDRTGASAPPARQGHAMAYDPVDAAVLVFGGAAGSGYLDDTWRYDGATGAWTSVATTGGRPSARFSVRMEFDPTRDGILLYGGVASGVTEPDVWIWERTRSAFVDLGAPAGLRSRHYHGTAYDTARGKLVVFSGVNIENSGAPTLYLDDLWEL